MTVAAAVDTDVVLQRNWLVFLCNLMTNRNISM